MNLRQELSEYVKFYKAVNSQSHTSSDESSNKGVYILKSANGKDEYIDVKYSILSLTVMNEVKNYVVILFNDLEK